MCKTYNLVTEQFLRNFELSLTEKNIVYNETFPFCHNLKISFIKNLEILKNSSNV